MRESSVQGGFVISYYFNGRAYHAPVMPFTHPTTSAITYSLDDGKTKFYDLLQLVEFYQLNKGTLCAKLSHFVINKPESHLRSESPESNSSCKHANSDVSLDSSKNMAEEGASSSSSSAHSATDNNHNSKAKASTMETSSEEESVTNNPMLDNEAPMPSEDEEN